ncbi:hypothetical protein-transmembrane region and signal peptide prediction [Rhodopirellula baltica SH 1]|uniref:Uncharacterized protein n=1 Tax=Rhodopirellula baltica (strain DSM 10527 / NCIMB 13988 / SH1) TaxID=243090 RepID=Q7USQ5_RHOBA|nr:hypothetical protein-transmembrane region and signal peptide prediction [Rhodopirellula baltica SH 1]
MAHNIVFTLGLRHTFLGWSRGLALIQSLVVQALLASFRVVSSETSVTGPTAHDARASP